ncbi:MAG: MATE family efflux transporter, partial [Ruminococcaceae bacterium]|nr:MATE family efflux transporter [Oscillospiraceae bacterium]
MIMKCKQIFSLFSRNIDMTQGRIIRQLLLFSFPLILTNLLQQFYNMADAAIVGRFDSAASLAAVGVAGTATTVLICFLNGFVNGVSIVVAQNYGSGNGTLLEKSIHTAYALSLIAGLFLTVTGLLCSTAILGLLNVPEDIYDATLLYTRIVFSGSIFNSVYCFSAGILRAEGDSRNPLIFLAISGMVNVLLNMILVIWFHLGVAGVGIATLVSQILSAVLATISLLRADGVCRLSFRKLVPDLAITKEIFRLGIPASIQSAMFSISNTAILSSVNRFGSTMTAGCTAAGNVEGCLFQVTSAFGASAVTFSSQNYGAGNKKRIKQGALQCSLLTMGTSFILGILILLSGNQLLQSALLN